MALTKKKMLETETEELRKALLSLATILHKRIQEGEVLMLPGHTVGNADIPCEFVLLANLVLTYRKEWTKEEIENPEP